MILALENGVCHWNLNSIPSLSTKIRRETDVVMTSPVNTGYVYPVTKSTTERVHLF